MEARNKISEWMGQALLRGECMLNEECTACSYGVPLMRKKNSTDAYCVYCQHQPQQEQEQVLVPQAIISQSQQESMDDLDAEIEEFMQQERERNKSTEPTPEQGTKKQKLESTSDIIGQKLLMGWTMLNEHCDVDNVPLLLDKSSQRKVCVECDGRKVSTPLITQTLSSPSNKTLLVTLQEKLAYLKDKLQQPRLTYAEIRDISEAIGKCAEAMLHVSKLEKMQ